MENWLFSEQLRLGQTALGVCQAIVIANPDVEAVRLISHRVGINWRQERDTPDKQRADLLGAFWHDIPTGDLRLDRRQFVNLTAASLPALSARQVWSVTSQVTCRNGQRGHLAMMNLHPDRALSLDDLEKGVAFIDRGRGGVLLDSGRHQHYYGGYLLTEHEWLDFMATFLMPCILVSPRYIGHRLHHGYCSLRLTADPEFKPTVPWVTKILPSE